MSKIIGDQTSWINGISFSDKEGAANSYAYGRAIDHRSDPKAVTLNPRAELDSGSVVTDLPMWGARACSRTFAYGNTGKLYQQENDEWSLVHTVPSSQGNGLAYFTADSALYYTQDTTFGRLLDACTGSTFYDDVLGSEGGAPTNTKSLQLLSASSQYASRADTASLSITSDLSLEIYAKLTSLPTSGESVTLLSKWDEQSDERSYIFDITTTSNFFGDGSDGALTISADTTEAPIDSACSGTIATYSLSATNASFAAGQQILIHQTQGTSAGQYQLTSIASYTAGTITTTDALTLSFSSSGSNKAQVRVLKQYTNVTINSGKTYSVKAWDGTVGGIIGWYANGTTTITGTLSANGSSGSVGSGQPAGGTGGFRGGYGERPTGTSAVVPRPGEGQNGWRAAIFDNSEPDGMGGGAGTINNGLLTHSGSGGGHATSGGYFHAGGTYGSADLTTMTFGGGGGGGGCGDSAGASAGGGGGGGAIICVLSEAITVSGAVTANGGVGGAAGGATGGSGAGGSIQLRSQTATLGSALITATGGASGGGNGGVGGAGRIAVYYSDSYTGTTSPTALYIEDTTLSGTSGYALRLRLSSNGTTTETHSVDITSMIDTSTWNRWQVTWTATTSTVILYKGGTPLRTSIGSITSLYNSTARFAIGCDFNTSGTARNFLNALVDDGRVWNDVRTQSELLTYNDQILTGSEANLVANYQYESDVTDSQTSGLNDLTAVNSPTYSSDIPFSGLTTRNDQDQGLTSGSFVQGYTLTTAINEGATHRQTFVPTKDPQKSITIDIDTVGTGTWTLTVHDSLNRTVATKSIASTELYTGFYEFIFSSVWRPILDASYHFHLTSTVADGIVDTTGASDLETAYFTTHYQFLVSDIYHPVKEFLDFMVMGNERYLAKYEAGNVFNPHRLTFPSGYRVRCLAYWREFIVIGCWKGTAITDYDDGRLFFWDGVSDTYNHSIPVPEGGVNAMFGTQDVLYLVAGYTGEILVYTGGGSATKFNKIPLLETGEYVEIAPGSMDMWRSNIHMGVNLNTDSSTVHKGVYSIGTSNSAYAPSLGFDFPTSLGDQTTSLVKVGMVFPSGQNLYIGRQNGNAFGIDSINPTNDVYSSGTVELLIADMGQISKEKYPLIIRADFAALESGHSVQLKYKSDRDDSWQTSTDAIEDTEDAMEVKLRVPERMKELQVKVDISTTIATSPKLLGVTVVSEVEESSGRNE